MKIELTTFLINNQSWLILFGSLALTFFLVLSAKYTYIIANHYYNKQKSTDRLKQLLRMDTDTQEEKFDIKATKLFKLETYFEDNFEKAFAKLNFQLYIHLQELIYFVGLTESLGFKNFILMSLGSALISMIALAIIAPKVTILGILMIFAPYFYLYYLKDQKIKTFVSFFPSVLESIANNLKAGVDIIRAFKVVAEDEENFFSKDFKFILAEIELGMPIADAVAHYAKKMNISEVELFAMGIRLSMKSGSNLAIFFSQISDMIRRRINLKGKVNMVTSESRFSMLIMVMAPFAIAAVQGIMDPVRYSTFLQTAMGQILIYGSIILITVALFWVNALMDIDEN